MDKKVYESVISGKSDYNISFTDFQTLINNLGFDFKRQDGSHMIYRHDKYGINMNIQPDGSKAKAYQVKQLRNFMKKYGLK